VVHDGPQSEAMVDGVAVRWLPLVDFAERVQAVVEGLRRG